MCLCGPWPRRYSHLKRYVNEQPRMKTCFSLKTLVASCSEKMHLCVFWKRLRLCNLHFYKSISFSTIGSKPYSCSRIVPNYMILFATEYSNMIISHNRNIFFPNEQYLYLSATEQIQHFFLRSTLCISRPVLSNMRFFM